MMCTKCSYIEGNSGSAASIFEVSVAESSGHNLQAYSRGCQGIVKWCFIYFLFPSFSGDQALHQYTAAEDRCHHGQKFDGRWQKLVFGYASGQDLRTFRRTTCRLKGWPGLPGLPQVGLKGVEWQICVEPDNCASQGDWLLQKAAEGHCVSSGMVTVLLGLLWPWLPPWKDFGHFPPPLLNAQASLCNKPYRWVWDLVVFVCFCGMPRLGFSSYGSSPPACLTPSHPFITLEYSTQFGF